jgi:hypothetical protein
LKNFNSQKKEFQLNKYLVLALGLSLQLLAHSNNAHADELIAGTRLMTCASTKDSKVTFDVISNAGKNSFYYDGYILYNLTEIEDPKALHFKMTLDSVTTNIVVVSMDGTRNLSATSTDTDISGKQLTQTTYICKPTF